MQIEGLQAAIKRKQDKKQKLLDSIAISQLGVQTLEVTLNREQEEPTQMKNKHLEELRAHLPSMQQEPAAQAMADMAAQFHVMMGLLGQIAGTPGIDPNVAVTIAQVILTHLPTAQVDVSPSPAAKPEASVTPPVTASLASYPTPSPGPGGPP